MTNLQKAIAKSIYDTFLIWSKQFNLKTSVRLKDEEATIYYDEPNYTAVIKVDEDLGITVTEDEVMHLGGANTEYFEHLDQFVDFAHYTWDINF